MSDPIAQVFREKEAELTAERARHAEAFEEARQRLQDVDKRLRALCDGARALGLVLATPSPYPAHFSVKEFVLREAQLAFPEPVRAASLNQSLKASGYDVHPKTVGMSLYRWSEAGALRRLGNRDWFFVPETERRGSADVR